MTDKTIAYGIRDSWSGSGSAGKGSAAQVMSRTERTDTHFQERQHDHR